MGLIKFEKEGIKNFTKFKQKFKELKKTFQKINEQFCEIAISKIISMANENLENESYTFHNTTDIPYRWHFEREITFDSSVKYKIWNDSPFSVLVEFGTGIVGGNEPHDMAQVVGYEYGKETWNFIRDLTSNQWVVHPNYSKDDIRANPEKYLVIRNFAGYKGKEYLYSAIFDYFEKQLYIKDYEKIMKKFKVFRNKQG